MKTQKQHYVEQQSTNSGSQPKFGLRPTICGPSSLGCKKFKLTKIFLI